MALDELYSLGFDNYLKHEECIRGVSQDETTEASKEFFDFDKSCSVVILPEKDSR